jgi:hypothetical protein
MRNQVYNRCMHMLFFLYKYILIYLYLPELQCIPNIPCSSTTILILYMLHFRYNETCKVSSLIKINCTTKTLLIIHILVFAGTFCFKCQKKIDIHCVNCINVHPIRKMKWLCFPENISEGIQKIFQSKS